jgi:uncharacterized protein DUF6851/vanadium-dependent haloperoxidase-like protein
MPPALQPGHAPARAQQGASPRLKPERHAIVAVGVWRAAERLKRVKHKLAATLVVVATLVAATAAAVTSSAPAAKAANGPAWPIDTWGTPRASDNVVLKWNEQLLNTIRRNPKTTGPTIAARAMGILNTAIYDAWAPYDPVAVGTRLLGQFRRPDAEDTLSNKNEAISYAAYRVLNDLFKDPTSVAAYNQQMSDLGYPVDTAATDTTTPQGIGNVTAQAEIDFRHGDRSNQLGDNPHGTPGVPYSDYTGYQPVNTWQTVTDPWRWQPLCVPLVPYGTPCPTSGHTVQQPYTPQWGKVIPFGLDPNGMPNELPSLPGPRKLADGSYDPSDIDQALRDTSNLTDAQKVTAEYWADGPGTAFPPGHMVTFGEALSRMRSDTLDQDVKLFFALGNGVMDAGIAAWNVKYQYDSVRPITAIRERYKNQQVTSWLGPGKGFGHVLGQDWMPYQNINVVTPPFPEYVSGHSTFTAAGRTILAFFYGTDNFNAQVTIPAGSSSFEPGITPRKPVVLTWKTLTDAADQAGMSRRWGGIHFQTGDMDGRALGKVVGYDDWNKAQTFIKGTATAPA